jgi:hypothetical protein
MDGGIFDGRRLQWFDWQSDTGVIDTRPQQELQNMKCTGTFAVIPAASNKSSPGSKEA